MTLIFKSKRSGNVTFAVDQIVEVFAISDLNVSYRTVDDQIKVVEIKSDEFIVITQ